MESELSEHEEHGKGEKCSVFSEKICDSCKHEMENTIIENIETLEKFLLFLFAVRSGYSQVNHGRSNKLKYFELHNKIIRIFLILQAIRFILLLIFDSDFLSIILADPFIHLSRRKVIFILVIYAIVALGLFREYVLYLEGRNCFSFLSTFSQVRKLGFDKRSFKMTNAKLQRFRVIFLMISNFFIGLMYLCYFFVPILLILVRFNNKIYSEILSINIASLLWIPLETHSIYFAVCGVFIIATHIILILPYYYFQMMSLVELLEQFILKKESVSLDIFRGLSSNTIRFLNGFDDLNRELKYLISYVFVIFSFMGDTFLFSGVILTQASTMLAIIFAAFGMVVLSVIGIETFIVGGFVSQLLVINQLYLKLMRRSKFITTKNLKVINQLII